MFPFDDVIMKSILLNECLRVNSNVLDLAYKDSFDSKLPVILVIRHLRSLLLTRFSFNPNMDK